VREKGGGKLLSPLFISYIFNSNYALKNFQKSRKKVELLKLSNRPDIITNPMRREAIRYKAKVRRSY